MCSPGVTAREEVLAALAALGPGVTDAVSLLGQVRDLAGFADQIQGELARLTGVLDAAGGASEAGYTSTTAFLRHGCGRGAGRAGELVATGRALRTLEATGKALMAGEISFDAAHVICRTAAQIPGPAMAQLVEEQMLAFARNLPRSRATGRSRTQTRDRTAASKSRMAPAPGRTRRRAGLPVQERARGGRPRRWIPVSCGTWARNFSTALIPMGWRSGNANGSSAGTCRSGSPSTAAAP